MKVGFKDLQTLKNFYIFDVFKLKCYKMFGATKINIRAIIFRQLIMQLHKIDNLKLEDLLSNMLSKCD